MGPRFPVVELSVFYIGLLCLECSLFLASRSEGIVDDIYVLTTLELVWQFGLLAHSLDSCSG